MDKEQENSLEKDSRIKINETTLTSIEKDSGSQNNLNNSNCRKLLVVLWKSWHFRKHHYTLFPLEILTCIILCLLLFLLFHTSFGKLSLKPNFNKGQQQNYSKNVQSKSRSFEDTDPPKSKEMIVNEMVSAVFFPTVWIAEDKLPKSIQAMRKLERLEENKIPESSRVYVIRENKFILAFSPKDVEFSNEFMFQFGTMLKKAIYRHWTITDPEQELGPGALQLLYRGYQNEGEIETAFKKWRVASRVSHKNGTRRLGSFIGGIVLPTSGLSTKWTYKLRLSDRIFKTWANPFLFYPLGSHDSVPMSPHNNSQDSESDSWIPSPFEKSPYATSEFLGLQILIEEAFIKMALGLPASEKLATDIVQTFGEIPSPTRKKSQDDFILSFAFPIAIALSFIFTNILMVQGMTSEKETGFKGLLKIHGLGFGMNFLGWAIMTTVVLILVSTILSLTFSIAFLKYANGFLLWVIIFCYGAHTFCLAFLISSIFAKAMPACLSAIALYLASFLGALSLLGGGILSNSPYLDLSLAPKLFLCVIPNFSLYFSTNIILGFEGQEKSAGWSNLYEPFASWDHLTIGYIWTVQLITSTIFIILGFYLENVLPSTFGVKKPWYYPFQKTTWCDGKVRSSSKVEPRGLHQLIQNDGVNFEPDPVDLTPIVSLYELTKVYDKKTAVDGVSLHFYNSQITAILGHNGTGKSTLMAMLTGLTNPTRGTALINGSDITKDLNSAQRSMSFCPQENLQSNSLNVKEHLKLFALLKGCSFKEADEEALDWIKKLKLEDKKATAAQKLSGGQKRKLQLGMALIRSNNNHSNHVNGNGNEDTLETGHVVFLDEPSSGLDPQARRDIWDIFISCRGTISIIFSTHFTDEADMLADRVVIMRAGKLQCIGSPFFLKDVFGNGYTLHLTLQNHYKDSNVSNMTISDPDELIDNDSFITPCPRFRPTKPEVDIEKQNEQDQQILSIVQSHFPKAVALPTKSTDSKTEKLSTRQLNINILGKSHSSSNSSNMLSSQTQASIENNETTSESVPESKLSKSELDSGSKLKSSPTLKFPALFSAIETRAQEIGISHISLSFTSMDDVFSATGAQEYSTSENTLHENLFMHGNLHGCCNLGCAQFKALLLKKLLVTWRKRPLLLFQILAPLIITIAAILSLSLNYAQDSVQPPPRTIALSAYSTPITLFSSSSKNMTSAFKSVVGPSAQELKKKIDIKNEFKRIGLKSPGELASRYIVAAELSDSSMFFLYSSKAPHSAPLAVNMATNIIIQKLAKESSGTAVEIQVVNSPFISNKKLDRDLERLEKVRYEKELNEQYVYRAFSMFFHPFGFILMFGLFGGFAVSFVYIPAQEKVSQWKHLQMMTRISPVSYWFAIFIVDSLIAVIIFLVMISLIPIFLHGFGQFTPLMGQNGLGIFFLILLTFLYVNIFIAYIASALAKTVTGTIIFLAIFQCIIVPVLYLLVVSLTLLGLQQSNKLQVPQDYTGAIDTVINLFTLFPSFNTLLSFTSYSEIAERNIACRQIPKEILDFTCVPKSKNDSLFNSSAAICCRNCLKDFPHLPCFKIQSYLGDLNEGRIGTLLLLQWIVGTILLIILGLIEYKVVEKCRKKRQKQNKMHVGEKTEIKVKVEAEPEDRDENEDEDVASEVLRVSKEVGRKQFDVGDCFLANGLTKSFQNGRIKAVSNISFAVRKDQCFGLLGQNAAGKSTMFRMLVGQEISDSGNAYINTGSGDLNYNLDTNKRKFLNHIGYCPQFDAFSGFMTGKELLLFMGRLRGIDSKNVKNVAEQWLQQMGLEKSANVQSKKYSGGMKRKLSSALALIGSPKIILLDEPTTGIDPEARRKFWNVLSRAQAAGQVIILTSHSMEECESLCSNLCIMVNGKMRCIGGVDNLKSRFAPGRDLTIKLTSRIPLDSELLSLQQQIKEKLDPCALKDQHGNILQYQIQNKEVLWSILFQIMEEIKTQHPDLIQEYTIQETTLEQVFLTIVKSQREREGRKHQRCKHCCC